MPENLKWVFIVNPVAGNGYGNEIIPELKERIIKSGIAADIVLTERSGHAEELSAQFASSGYNYIIAVGGDGTFNEVSRPLINSNSVVTGIIPAGTGNDFIQILGFPDRFGEKDWEIFFKRNIAAMDTGICNGRIFTNGMGLGFDAQVAAENYTGPGKVKKGGKNKYIWHIVKTLLLFRENRMKVITPEGNHETECFINTVANGRRFAGGFFLTPKAIANDALLDVCMIRKLNLFHRLRLLLKVPKGLHINDKRVNYLQTKKLELEFDREVPYHLDGELFFASSLKISVLPKAIKIIYNPDGNHYFGSLL